MSAASGGNSEPKQGQRSQSARGFCPRSTMRVPQPDIIEHFGNADAVPQLPERCLSRKAGIVRCCLRSRPVAQDFGMQRALVVLDNIFVCANPQPAERSRPFPTNWAGFLPSFHTIQIQNQNNRPPAGISYFKQTGGYLNLSYHFGCFCLAIPQPYCAWLTGSMMACTTKRWLLEA